MAAEICKYLEKYLLGFSIFLAACSSGSNPSKLSINSLDFDANVVTQCDSNQLRHSAGNFVEVPFVPRYLIGVGASQFELLSDFESGELAILKGDCVALVNFSEEILETSPPQLRHPGILKKPFGGRVTETKKQAVGRCVDTGKYEPELNSSDFISYSIAEPCQFIVDMETLELVITTRTSKTNLFLAFDTMFIWGENDK